jgi:hypothetical protein
MLNAYGGFIDRGKDRRLVSPPYTRGAPLNA